MNITFEISEDDFLNKFSPLLEKMIANSLSGNINIGKPAKRYLTKTQVMKEYNVGFDKVTEWELQGLKYFVKSKPDAKVEHKVFDREDIDTFLENIKQHNELYLMK